MNIFTKWQLLGILICIYSLAFAQSDRSMTTGSTINKHALIIGNAAYSKGPLKNPVNDARLMERTLKQLGFSTAVSTDATQRGMKQAILNFTKKLDRNSVAIFYYAGHGIEVKKNNYLIPVDASLTEEGEADIECVKLESAIESIAETGCNQTIVILDACRDNPFARSWSRSGGSRTIGSIASSADVLVLYATQPGNTASDGTGVNGLFTTALVKYMNTPGYDINKVMIETKKEVQTASKNAQRPYLEGIPFDFVFNPSNVTPTPTKEKIVVANDRDDDGLADNIDKCPDEYGSVKNEGCPEEAKPPRARTVAERMAVKEEEIEVPVGSRSMVMRYVAGSSFIMGSDNGDTDEKPAHRVNVDNVYMCKYEVTVGEYLEFCKATNSNWPEWLESGSKYHIENSNLYKNLGYRRAGSEKLPIAGVSWDNATAYAKWLSQKTGINYRLPTEAEWEYAAKGGQNFKYAGSENIEEVGWYTFNSGDKPNEVGKLKANGYGLHDMSGNVMEWTADWYKGYTGSSGVTDYTGVKRVTRGCCWFNFARFCLVSGRGPLSPGDREKFIGFRLAASQ